MQYIRRRELLLMLVGLNDQGATAGSVSGITRLQKFLFLLEQQEEIHPSGDGFEFEAYKAGPYSSRLYDDLELLENLGLIRTEATAESTITESVDINRLSFEDLFSGFDQIDGGSRARDSFEERKFTLTKDGREKLDELLKCGDYEPVVEGIRKVKSKYSRYSLRDLLKYVYTNYPGWTTESEIIDEVLGRNGD